MSSIISKPALHAYNQRKKVVALTAVVASYAVQATQRTSLSFLFREPPKPKRTSSLTGGEYIKELLADGHEGRIQEVLRMKLKPLKALCTVMREKELLSDSIHISIVELLRNSMPSFGFKTFIRFFPISSGN